MTYRRMMGCLAALAVFGNGPLWADVKMPAIFGDHMVLQQDIKLPVWGTADAGEKITVKVGNESATATAGNDGKWLVKLDPLAAGTTPVTMTVAGKNNLKFEDVLVGDVWVCSGQSNMAFQMAHVDNSATELPKANDPGLRLFLVTRKMAFEPQTDVAGKWEVCTPDTVAPFSGVAYFFGRELRSTLHHPIGLIGTYWGGTPAQAWTSLSGLEKDPSLQDYIKLYNRNKEQADALTKQAAAQPATKLVGGPQTPSGLFNGMVAPLIPYALKGVIWYQGEANARPDKSAEYNVLFSRMITDWREKWGQGDFPFLFVQLPKFAKGSEWPLLREAQLKTLALPNTGMAVAIDVGNPVNLHPTDKLDVGLRLALAAGHVAYGQKLVYSGPIYKAMQVEGNTVRLTFTQTGSGLMIGTAPWVAPGAAPLSTATLLGFEIAGADKKWAPADAKIDGAAVVVSSPQVSQPVAVRYAWAGAPDCNLYNREGLPASPFRTDDWDVASQPRPPQAAAPKP